MPCPTCHDAPDAGWCPACGGSSTREALLGVAATRGMYWAYDVARLVPEHKPWPPFEGKARSIALRRVADLGGDEATRELRARECHRAAGEEWERIWRERG